jgi:hypothetical protein
MFLLAFFGKNIQMLRHPPISFGADPHNAHRHGGGDDEAVGMFVR